MAESAVSREMKEEMAAFEKEVEAWRDAQIESVRSLKQDLDQRQARSEEDLEKLSHEEADLREKKIAQHRAAELARLEVSATQTATQRLSHELNAMPTKLNNIEQQLVQAQERLEKHRSELRSSVEANARRLRALTQGALFFKQRLGLEFEVIDSVDEHKQYLRILFSNLGPEFKDNASFLLHIEGDVYSIENCEPSLGKTSADLVKRLNESNEFAWFVQSMRRSFQSHFSSE